MQGKLSSGAERSIGVLDLALCFLVPGHRYSLADSRVGRPRCWKAEQVSGEITYHVMSLSAAVRQASFQEAVDICGSLDHQRQLTVNGNTKEGCRNAVALQSGCGNLLRTQPRGEAIIVKYFQRMSPQVSLLLIM
jgi:hypothetical protein